MPLCFYQLTINLTIAMTAARFVLNCWASTLVQHVTGLVWTEGQVDRCMHVFALLLSVSPPRSQLCCQRKSVALHTCCFLDANSAFKELCRVSPSLILLLGIFCSGTESSLYEMVVGSMLTCMHSGGFGLYLVHRVRPIYGGLGLEVLTQNARRNFIRVILTRSWVVIYFWHRYGPRGTQDSSHPGV